MLTLFYNIFYSLYLMYVCDFLEISLELFTYFYISPIPYSLTTGPIFFMFYKSPLNLYTTTLYNLPFEISLNLLAIYCFPDFCSSSKWKICILIFKIYIHKLDKNGAFVYLSQGYLIQMTIPSTSHIFENNNFIFLNSWIILYGITLLYFIINSFVMYNVFKFFWLW